MPTHNKTRHPVAAMSACIALLIALAGCSNMAGIGGTSEFNCKAPSGVPCRSVSAVDHALRHGGLDQGSEPGKPMQSSSAPAYPQAAANSLPSYRPARLLTNTSTATSAEGGADEDISLGAIRSEPTILRIWVAPYEDSDGDLHEASRVYLQIDNGRWLIERNQQRIRTQFAPQPGRSAAAPVRPEPAKLSQATPGLAPIPQAQAAVRKPDPGAVPAVATTTQDD